MERVATRPSSRATLAPRRRPRSAPRRRRTVVLLAALLVASVLAALVGRARSGPRPTPFEARLVRIADSQLGYRTDPADTYCNRFSAYWRAGSTDCPRGERAEEWCADFAAWVWRTGGARFTYGYGPGDIDAASASFYLWGRAHHRWHPVGSGYRPRPGDVAVYGLDRATTTAVHVAVVTGDTPGAAGPDVVNGDGARTGFSVVETGTDEYKADLHDGGGRLSGYVSPLPPVPPRRTRPAQGTKDSSPSMRHSVP